MSNTATSPPGHRIINAAEAEERFGLAVLTAPPVPSPPDRS
ncbi:hypothetical protein ACQPYK_29595 [Streptosporangium sp. CA-135522]